MTATIAPEHPRRRSAFGGPTRPRRPQPARSSTRTPRSLALPAVLGLLAFSAFPLIYLLSLSVTDSTLAWPLRGYVGLENYSAAFSSAAFTGSLWRSTLFAVTAAAVQLVLGTALALLLRARGPRLGWTGVVLLLPLVTPPVMAGVAWRLLLDPTGGAFAAAVQDLGHGAFNPLGSGPGAFGALLVIDTWQWTPFVALLVYAALLGTPSDLHEAARIDGAGPRQTLRHITLPYIAPTLLSVLLLRLIIAFKAFDIVYVVTSGGPGFSTTLSTFEIHRTALQNLEVGTAAAATVLFSLVVGVLATVVAVVRSRVVAAQR